MSEIPEQLSYTAEHEWVRVEGDQAGVVVHGSRNQFPHLPLIDTVG